MTSLRLPTDLGDRYAQLADDLDGFDRPEELARYVLDATADELSRDEVADSGSDHTIDADDGSDRADDDVVEDRLEQLGYLEK